MGTISSGIGLISGLNITDLVDQLMAIEARPRDLLNAQVNDLDSRKAAWLDLSARLLALKSAAAGFDETDTFNAVATSSSASSVLTATASAGAAEGNYSFTPARLMTSHQVISSGFANADASPVGAGTITIEIGHGRLDPAAALDFLNGQTGVARGEVRITDRSGASADIDLTAAVTVDDVLDAINQASGISVTATVAGDRIVLTDTSGSTSASLTVAEVAGGTVAADLGILGSAVGNVLTGSDIVSINSATNLSQLNDGNGIRVRAGSDLKITLEDGTELLVDLSSAGTVDDVLDAINDATGNGGKLVAAIGGDGDRLTLTDNSAGGGTLTVEAVSTSLAAADLGLLGADGDADHVISGLRLAGGLKTVLLRNLNGGSGVDAASISITDRGGGSAGVDLSSAETVDDVIAAINAAAGVSVSAALNAVGNGIAVTDASGLSVGNFIIAESGGTAAADLNLLHDAADTLADSGNLQVRYVSENTSLTDFGLVRGRFVITDSAGESGTVDLTQGNETTIGDVIAEINSRGIGVTASINANGDGLLLTDTAGGAGRLTVTESGSTTASSLGLLGADTDDDGVIDGSRELTIAVGAADTLEDLADAISAASVNLTAFVVNDGTATNPYRLAVASGVGGLAGRLNIDPGAVPVSFSTMVAPADALLFLGDPANPSSIAITSRSNTFSNVIDGVTLTATGVSDSPVNVSITRSIDSFVSQVNSFVTAFNSTIDRIDALTSFDAEAGTRGVLQGTIAISQVRSSLFSMVTAAVSSAPGAYSRLGQIGLSVTDSGTHIGFDADAFRAAYAAAPSAVSGLFTLATSGVGDRIDTALSNLTDSYTGTIPRQTDSLDSRRDLLTDRIEQLDTLLASKRARLLRQFQAMESALAALQAQQSAMTSMLSSLNLAIGGSSSSSSSG